MREAIAYYAHTINIYLCIDGNEVIHCPRVANPRNCICCLICLENISSSG